MCARDDELRREVESLLASHDRAGDFLDNPPPTWPALFGGRSQAVQLQSSTRRAIASDRTNCRSCIGRGGMGSVWLATRCDKNSRSKVAIKLVKRGMDTQEILRRFRLERQVLAGLTHPNIAALIDGGSTPDGLPYLVMEYVEGIRIDRYCEKHKSTITERLKLFRDVCAAVQYAHREPGGPSRSQAGEHPGHAPKACPSSWISESPISRWIPDAGRPKRGPKLRPMTLDYASPEQVRGEPITTPPTSIRWAFLLYKLLTGKSPYGRVHSREEFRRAICEREPLKASAVVVSNEKASIPQATEAIELGIETRDKARRRLRKKLSGDLDAILHKSLSKEPLDRYLSAEQFSEDLRRYLEGRPVRARRDNAAYRFSKFVRRNAAVLSAGVVVLAAVVALGISAALVARRAEVQLLEAQAREAQLRSQQVRTLLALGEFDQRAGNPRAKEDFASALEAAQGDRQITEANRGLGIEEFRAGSHLAAFARFTESLTAAEAWIKRERNNPEAYTAMAAANYLMGQALVANGETGAAGPKLHKAFEMFRDLAGSPDVNPEDQSAEAYEAAIRQLAKVAPAGLANSIAGSSLFAETAPENR